MGTAPEQITLEHPKDPVCGNAILKNGSRAAEIKCISGELPSC